MSSIHFMQPCNSLGSILVVACPEGRLERHSLVCDSQASRLALLLHVHFVAAVMQLVMADAAWKVILQDVTTLNHALLQRGSAT